jgi:hypothetical protein
MGDSSVEQLKLSAVMINRDGECSVAREMFSQWNFNIPLGFALLNADHIQSGGRIFHWGSLPIFNEWWFPYRNFLLVSTLPSELPV